MLWDLNEGKHLYTLDGNDVINALCFSPNRYWLCAAVGPSIKIWVRTKTEKFKRDFFLTQNKRLVRIWKINALLMS